VSGARRPWKALLLSVLMLAVTVAAAAGRRRPGVWAWAGPSFFGLCTLVLARAVATGGRRRRPPAVPAGEVEQVAAAVLGPRELPRRRPVWRALSELFLDTELQPGDHVSIARTLLDSGYDDPTWLGILVDEVGPVCGLNLLSAAGVWTGFDPGWLEGRILGLCSSGRVARRVSRLGAGLVPLAISRDLAAIRAALGRLRQDPAALARALSTGSPGERVAAARELAFLGRDAAAVAAVVREVALDEAEPEVRAASIEALWRLEWLRALDVALAAAADPAPAVRRAGVACLAAAAVDPAALRRSGPHEVPEAAVAGGEAELRGPGPVGRKEAAAALGALAVLGAPGALAVALTALDEEDVGVRHALGRAAVLGGADERSLAPVAAALSDRRSARRRTAAQVLATVAQDQGARAGWALEPLLAAARGEDPVAKRTASVALGRLRGAAVPARALLAEGTVDPDPELRAACLRALSQVDAARGAPPPLEQLLAALGSRDVPVQQAAYHALCELGAAAAPLLPRLEAMANEPKGPTGPRASARVLVDRLRGPPGPVGAAPRAS